MQTYKRIFVCCFTIQLNYEHSFFQTVVIMFGSSFCFLEDVISCALFGMSMGICYRVRVRLDSDKRGEARTGEEEDCSSVVGIALALR